MTFNFGPNPDLSTVKQRLVFCLDILAITNMSNGSYYLCSLSK